MKKTEADPKSHLSHQTVSMSLRSGGEVLAKHRHVLVRSESRGDDLDRR